MIIASVGRHEMKQALSTRDGGAVRPCSRGLSNTVCVSFGLETPLVGFHAKESMETFDYRNVVYCL